jgi:hypothetical protein
MRPMLLRAQFGHRDAFGPRLARASEGTTDGESAAPRMRSVTPLAVGQNSCLSPNIRRPITPRAASRMTPATRALVNMFAISEMSPWCHGTLSR